MASIEEDPPHLSALQTSQIILTCKIIPLCNFLIITFELASLKRLEFRVFHTITIASIIARKYAENVTVQGSFSRFHGHSINYLHKYCRPIFHLERINSSDSFPSPPLQPPESNHYRMCITLNWVVSVSPAHVKVLALLLHPYLAKPASLLFESLLLEQRQHTASHCCAPSIPHAPFIRDIKQSSIDLQLFLKSICLARGINGARGAIAGITAALCFFQIKGTSIKSQYLAIDTCPDICSLSFSDPSILTLIAQNDVFCFVLICFDFYFLHTLSVMIWKKKTTADNMSKKQCSLRALIPHSYLVSIWDLFWRLVLEWGCIYYSASELWGC